MGASEVRIRRARGKDIAELVLLRRKMFEAMGYSNPSVLDEVANASTDYFECALPGEDFRAWVAQVDETIVAGIGLVIHTVPPTPRNLRGKEGYIMNLVTRPAWRCRGIATALLQVVLDALRTEGIPTASLHATAAGRRIYEAAGFEPSNEWVRLPP